MGGIYWIDLAQERNRWWALVNVFMNLWVPYNLGNFLTSWGLVRFSRRALLCGVSEEVNLVLTIEVCGITSNCIMVKNKLISLAVVHSSAVYRLEESI